MVGTSDTSRCSFWATPKKEGIMGGEGDRSPPAESKHEPLISTGSSSTKGHLFCRQRTPTLPGRTGVIWKKKAKLPIDDELRTQKPKLDCILRLKTP